MKSGICRLIALMLLGGVLYAWCGGGQRLAPLRQAVSTAAMMRRSQRWHPRLYRAMGCRKFLPRVELRPGAALGLALVIALDPAGVCLPFLLAAALHEGGLFDHGAAPRTFSDNPMASAARKGVCLPCAGDQSTKEVTTL